MLILNPIIHGFTTTPARSLSCFGRHRIAKSSTPLLNSDDTDGWKAGGVYGDLDRLEQAITVANAEQNLLHTERLQLLDHYAKARRPVGDDVSKFVVTPLECRDVFMLLIFNIPLLTNSKRQKHDVIILSIF